MRFSQRNVGVLGLFLVWLLGAPLFAPAHASDVAFDTWLEGLKSEARGRGISDKTLDAALGAAQPIPKVLSLDRSQPEFSKTFEQYLAGTVSPARVAMGRKLYAENAAILNKIGATALYRRVLGDRIGFRAAAGWLSRLSGAGDAGMGWPAVKLLPR